MKDILKTLVNGILEIVKSYRGDWNENNTSSPNYIKNRPFHFKKEMRTLMEGEVGLWEGWSPIPHFVLVEGEKYIITLDGTEYESYAHYDNSVDIVLIGDLRATDYYIEEDLEEPFCIYSPNEVETKLHISYECYSHHSVKIMGNVEIIKTLDEKYLPKPVGKKGKHQGSEIFNDYSYNEVLGEYAHAEGYSTTASESAHAEGYYSHATGETSHAEGYCAYSTGYISHAEGSNTQANGQCSHAEGYYASANGFGSHAEGYRTNAVGKYQHVQGKYNIIDNESKYAHIVGNGKDPSNETEWREDRSNAHTLDWNGNAWFSGDVSVGADNKKLATEEYVDSKTGSGEVTISDWSENDSSSSCYIKNRTHWVEMVEGTNVLVEETVEVGEDEYAEFDTKIILEQNKKYYVVYDGTEYECTSWYAKNEVFLGDGDIYGGAGMGENVPFNIENMTNDGSLYLNSPERGSHSLKIYEVGMTEEVHKIDEKFLPHGSIIGQKGFGEGAEIFNDYINNKANGEYSHAEGCQTKADNNYSHTEGWGTRAIGVASHAEGWDTEAYGTHSHAEGEKTLAYAEHSHTEGSLTKAYNYASHAEGYGTEAHGECQHTQGRYNIIDNDNKYLHIVGNGSLEEERSNAHTLDWDGNAWYKGEVYVGGTTQSEGKKLLSTADIYFNESGQLVVTINGVTKKFTSVE